MDNTKSWVDKVEKEKHPHVLIIDDERRKLCDFADELYLRGFDVTAVHAKPGIGRHEMPHHTSVVMREAKNPHDILELVRELKPDAVVSDWDLNWERIKGDALLQEIGFEHPGIVLTMHSRKYDLKGPRTMVHEEGFTAFPKRFGMAALAEHLRDRLDIVGHRGV